MYTRPGTRKHSRPSLVAYDYSQLGFDFDKDTKEMSTKDTLVYLDGREEARKAAQKAAGDAVGKLVEKASAEKQRQERESLNVSHIPH